MREKIDISFEAMAKALFGQYESLFDINTESDDYRIYHESNTGSEIRFVRDGHNFFEMFNNNMRERVCLEDQAYVLQMIDKEKVLSVLKKEGLFSLVYRTQSGETTGVYHQIRATLIELSNEQHIFMGIRNVNDMMQREIRHRKEIVSMRQKESNHLEAVLASAAAYMEANLTKDIVLERSQNNSIKERAFPISLPSVNEMHKYSDMQEWICGNLIAVNETEYREISSREYLTKCIEKGKKQESVRFSAYTIKGEIQPYREFFFLYKDTATEDVHVFCVIYDLTEHHKQKQEKKELEEALRMSRLHNSTSQMQPHFLYNSLASIQEVILIEPEYAYELLGDFTLHLKSCVRAMENDEPFSFEQELKNIQAYVNIEKMRFGEKLNVQYSTQVTDFPILPLSIQPIVENAIRHGVYERGKKGGTVTLCTEEKDDCWVIKVLDDGVGFDVDQYLADCHSGSHESTGLENITFRLQKMMGADLKIKSTIGKGTSVTISIPKEKG